MEPLRLIVRERVACTTRRKILDEPGRLGFMDVPGWRLTLTTYQLATIRVDGPIVITVDAEEFPSAVVGAIFELSLAPEQSRVA